ncbi:UDP-glucose/GDP-mannose dehydrogenase family protein [Ruminiclostridium herbifermentans]|uniref:UDP-glucose 6-dehydrogenase n=1 Tax=Ruminiclostridium herbifermentans TaxID=2488810 RepID=A0A4U7JFY8_9FIRM|nr:UDP-glucose/GDP-mannose dehydrogenase family protein [Ruminiclostridium herbifermentans]QNU66627.1 UDP-glucose/GDP-mannose dehydrogenase family protein [Ruminiclostridium herbifermentans]
MKITITGTGYVGIVTGVCLAEIGHTVTCYDIDKTRIKKLQDRIMPIFEPGLEEMVINNSERLSFISDYKEAYRDSEVVFICVGTPEKKDGSANLKYVYDAVQQVVECVKSDCTIVIKSTVPVGTGDNLDRVINQKNDTKRFEIVNNPEFLSQGTAINDTMNASRIVLGVNSAKAERILRNVYDGFRQKYVVTDRRSAEMIKYASNDFLALKISYINEIANLCDFIGANVEDVALGMGYDPRIGNRFLKAGIGYGGSCFPKDTKALHWLANFNDCELKTIKAAIDVNENQKIKLIKKARKYYDSFRGLTVAILGLTFKPGTDDLREAPSLQNIPILLEDGARVKVFDPIGMDNFKKIYPSEIEYCNCIEETLEDADICFILTEWPEIVTMDVSKFPFYMRNPIVLDGRNCFSLEAVEGKNFIYESIGRRVVGQSTQIKESILKSEKAG